MSRGPSAGREAARTTRPRRSVYSLSESETYELGRTLGQQVAGGELVLLEGPLGIGKTVFVRGLAAGLGIPPEEVSSPSFTLVQEYAGRRGRMVHVDLYRIEAVDDLSTLGLEELMGGGAVVVVEWGERLPLPYRRGALTVRFHDLGDASRRIELIPTAEPRPGEH